MFGREIRYAVRVLRAKPTFSVLAIAMLALGIGASTAIFTVVNSVLLRSLPYEEPERIVQLWEVSEEGNRMALPEANYVDWKAEADSFESMGMYAVGEGAVVGGLEPIRVRIATVAEGFFDVIGVRPVMGSGFLPEHQRSGASPVAMVSRRFWRDSLGSPDSLDGVRLTFSNRIHPAVGVLPEGLDYPVDTDIWDNQEAMGEALNPSRSAHNWRAIGRLAPGVTAEQASRQLETIAARIHSEYTDVTAVGGVAVPLDEQLTGGIRTPLLVLMAAVVILLLIACMNVTSLLLAHMEARQREFAVRTALGATPLQLSRGSLAETVILASLGGVLGVVLARWGVSTMLATVGGNLPRAGEIGPDPTVYTFAALLALAIAVLVGMLPAVRFWSGNLADALKAGDRGQAGSHSRARSALVTAQVAMTIVLLVGGSLLARSLVEMLEVDLGFETTNRLAVELIQPFPQGEAATNRLGAFQQAFKERITALPGVVNVGGIDASPLSARGGNGRFIIEDRGDSGDYWPNYRVSSPGYFRALGIPLLRGRLFDESDGAGAPGVAVISESVANRVWPGEDPIGHRIDRSNMDGVNQLMTIIGVVGDARYYGPDSDVRGETYFNYLQRGRVTARFTWIIETSGDPAAIGPAVMTHVKELDPELPIQVRTMDSMLYLMLSSRLFNLSLLGVFAGVALTLAVIGVYGLIAYTVAHRTAEIGVRTALGARSGQVVWLFVRESAALIGIGAVVGVLGAMATSRVLGSLLFEIEATDPAAYGIGVLALVVPAMLAGYVSARRAAKIDPVRAIQSE